MKPAFVSVKCNHQSLTMCALLDSASRIVPVEGRLVFEVWLSCSAYPIDRTLKPRVQMMSLGSHAASLIHSWTLLFEGPMSESYSE